MWLGLAAFSPHLTALTYKKVSGTGWLVPASLCSIPRHRGKRQCSLTDPRRPQLPPLHCHHFALQGAPGLLPCQAKSILWGHLWSCSSEPSFKGRAKCAPAAHLPTLPQTIPLPFPATSPSLQTPFICKTQSSCGYTGYAPVRGFFSI